MVTHEQIAYLKARLAEAKNNLAYYKSELIRARRGKLATEVDHCRSYISHTKLEIAKLEIALGKMPPTEDRW